MAQRGNLRSTVTVTPQRGQIYDVILDPVVGSEIGKQRPAIIVSNDINNEYGQTVTVVPLTGQASGRNYPFEVLIPRGEAGLRTDSRAKCNQVRTVDKRRLASFRGALSRQFMMQIDQAMRVHLNLD